MAKRAFVFSEDDYVPPTPRAEAAPVLEPDFRSGDFPPDDDYVIPGPIAGEPGVPIEYRIPGGFWTSIDGEAIPANEWKVWKCRECGAQWREFPASWSLVPGARAQKCCDNVPMGPQLERVPVDGPTGNSGADLATISSVLKEVYTPVIQELANPNPIFRGIERASSPAFISTKPAPGDSGELTLEKLNAAIEKYQAVTTPEELEALRRMALKAAATPRVYMRGRVTLTREQIEASRDRPPGSTWSAAQRSANAATRADEYAGLAWIDEPTEDGGPSLRQLIEPAYSLDDVARLPPEAIADELRRMTGEKLETETAVRLYEGARGRTVMERLKQAYKNFLFWRGGPIR